MQRASITLHIKQTACEKQEGESLQTNAVLLRCITTELLLCMGEL
jgi:hypothetical protein